MRGKTILAVDDEPAILAVLQDVLALDGYAVETASSGGAALQKLAERSYDVVLCDLRMPDVDGARVYEEAGRRDPGLLRRFVFLTGSLGASSLEFFLRAGRPFVRKPFDLDELRQTLRDVLERGEVP